MIGASASTRRNTVIVIIAQKRKQVPQFRQFQTITGLWTKRVALAEAPVKAATK